MELPIFFQCSKCDTELKATKKRASALVFEVEPCEHCLKIEREKNELRSNHKEK
jgi:hypothetical protein